MPVPDPEIRLFTLEEAEAVLPEVRSILNQLRLQKKKVEALEDQKAVEQLTWLQPDGTVSPKAGDAIVRIERQQMKEAKQFTDLLRRVTDLGAQLKDLDAGLIDFFAMRGDDLVLLCWRDGEDRIGYWHDLESGFPGRRPIGEF
jgi:hypothetical protein